MAGQGRDFSYTAGDIIGQAQAKKDDFLNQGSNVLNNASDSTHSAQNQTITSQATNFLHQTGEQVKNMAQGAADAVKSTLGMNADNPNTTNYSTRTGTGIGTGNTNYNTSTGTGIGTGTTNYDTSFGTGIGTGTTNYDNYDTSIGTGIGTGTTNYDTSTGIANFDTSTTTGTTNRPSNPSTRF